MDLLPFIYESTLILGFSFGFYYLFLKRSRFFDFIRIFFMFALLLAIVIPFVEVELSKSLPLVGSVGERGFYTLVPIYVEVNPGSSEHGLSLNSILSVVYFLGFGLMFFRFSLNLIQLIRKRKLGECIESPHGRIVLTKEKGLPYSFFRNIYINQHTLKKGEEADQLLLHEGVHCKQLHSMDILLVELLKVLLWFNPFVWLIANAIRLNHEYMADEKVQESQNTHTYQLLLINLELANQSIYLASEFNYSLTKKRLIMMNYKDKGKKRGLVKLAAVPLFLILIAALTFCEVEKEPELDPNQSMEFYANDWWRPILQKHDITPRAYNNFEFIFEMGSTNSIDENNVVTLTDAFFLIRTDESTYSILRSPLATHDLKTGIISGAEGILESFDLLQEDTEPGSEVRLINFTYLMVANKQEMSADYMNWHTNGEEVAKGWSGTFTAKDSVAINRFEE